MSRREQRPGARSWEDSKESGDEEPRIRAASRSVAVGENKGVPEAVTDKEEESETAEVVTVSHRENEGALDKKGGSTQGTKRKGVAASRQTRAEG